MEIRKEQIAGLRKQVIKQIESTFPEDKKNSAIEQIESMNEEQFIEFLKKNNLIKTSETGQKKEEINYEESPFRLIVKEKIPSYKIDENKDSLAVLEINPISKAHTIIIPKKSIKESGKIPSSLFILAKRISKKIKTKLKPKEVLISSSTVLGEVIVNVLPIYAEESLNSPRQKASKEELEKLKRILEKKSKPPRVKKPKIKEIKEEKILLPRRIP
jgi:histidine triad (HIT) family protein